MSNYTIKKFQSGASPSPNATPPSQWTPDQMTSGNKVGSCGLVSLFYHTVGTTPKGRQAVTLVPNHTPQQVRPNSGITSPLVERNFCYLSQLGIIKQPSSQASLSISSSSADDDDHRNWTAPFLVREIPSFGLRSLKLLLTPI